MPDNNFTCQSGACQGQKVNVPVDPLLRFYFNRKYGWRIDESTFLLPMWPGFNSQTLRHMWVAFVGSVLCSERFFSGYSSGFSPLLKNQPTVACELS